MISRPASVAGTVLCSSVMGNPRRCFVGMEGYGNLVRRRAHERIEAAGAVERMQLIEAADMRFADEYLRHGAPTAALDHFLAQHRVVLDVELAVVKALAIEQRLRAHAERAPARRINEDLGARRPGVHLVPLMSGRFSCRHALRPPRRFATCVKPSVASRRAAPPEITPVSQQTTTGFSR